MGNRYWLWTGARILVAGVVILWAASYMGPGSGEKEFQKTLDAMKHVHSLRASYTSNMSGNRTEALWELDCSRNILHYQSQMVPADNPSQEISDDELHVGGYEYYRKSKDEQWSRNAYPFRVPGSYNLCRRLADGSDTGVLPPIATLIQRAILQKGDKKTVNGVRCRQWLVTTKNGPYFEHDTICIGLDDHLPYEIATEGNLTHSSFSDYNQAIEFDAPEAAVKPANATSGTN
jgi:hypothetical protein